MGNTINNLLMELNTENLPVDPNKAGALTCESCGAEFTCNAGQETCWCFDVKAAPENLTALKENFNNCLCRDCLEKMRADEQQ
jgi:hypothetical protein